MHSSFVTSVRRGLPSPSLRPATLGAVKGAAAVLVALAVALAAGGEAHAETFASEEPVVLENGETVLQVSEFSAELVAAAASVRCKKVHGWHGIKHPLFGYFYWRYILTIRWCWEPGGTTILKTFDPWSPTYWRDVECCMQYSGWDFEGHTALDVDGGAGRSLYRVRAQGKFRQCYQFCFSAKTPWVRLTGYPGGAWGFAHGG